MIRRVSALAPFHWLIGATRILARHPGALLLGTFSALMSFSGLMLFVGLTIGTLLAALGFAKSGIHDRFVLLAISVPMMLLTMLIPQLLVGGIAHLIHGGETDGSTHPFNVYAGLRKHNFLRLSPLVSIQIFCLLATIVLSAVFGGEHYFADSTKYFSTLLSTPGNMVPKLPPPPEPRWPKMLFYATLVMNASVYLLQLFAPIHAVLGPRGGFAAIGDCVRGFLANAAAMAVAGMLCILLLFGFMLVVFCMLIVATAVAQSSPVFGSLFALMLMMVLASAGIALWVAYGYCGWREMYGPGDEAQESGSVAV